MFRRRVDVPWLRAVAAALPVALCAGTASAAEKITDPAPAWDRLWNTVMLDIGIMGGIFGLLILYFIYRYRRRNPGDEGNAPALTSSMAVGWAVIPVFVFMADDFYLAAQGWQLWNYYRDVPADRLEVKLTSGMYAWDYTYPNGVEAQNELRVPAGKPVVLRMTSRDTIHSHYISDFRVKEDSMPGRVTYLWFLPKKAGATHVINCAEYCGIKHSMMTGKVIVMEPAAFDAWYAGESAKLKTHVAKIEG